jgi:putative PIN family toxin of toxin-antitoxin system
VIVVFDSNIWISALRFGGIPMTALRAAFVRHTIASCEEIETEVVRVLNTKFGWDSESAAKTLKGYLDGSLRVQLSGSIQNVCRDPNDDMVLECALVAGATHIVSGDKDLISLKTYSGISILTAREYIEQFGKAPALP